METKEINLSTTPLGELNNLSLEQLNTIARDNSGIVCVVNKDEYRNTNLTDRFGYGFRWLDASAIFSDEKMRDKIALILVGRTERTKITLAYGRGRYWTSTPTEADRTINLRN